MRGSGMTRAVCAAVAGVCLLLSGCGLTMPRDPDGTLDRVRGEVVRVGVSEEPDLIERAGAAETDASQDVATGPLAELVTGFAAEQEAEVEWSFGSEESLVRDLEARRIDLAVGGMTADTPWIERVGSTRGYAGIGRPGGPEIVLFVPAGENALLAELERFLDAEMMHAEVSS